MRDSNVGPGAASWPHILRQGWFQRVWLGQTTSMVGSQLTAFVLPVAAVLILNATPAGVAALNASRFLPYLLITLPIGVYVDRHRRRPLMITADAVRVLVLAGLGVLMLSRTITLVEMCGLAAAAATFEVLFDTAFSSFLPSVMEKQQLTQSNSSLQGSSSFAQIAGPALGGLCVAALGPATALFADAGTFAISAGSLLTVRMAEPALVRSPGRAPFSREIAAGLRAVYRRPLLRAIVGEAAMFNVFESGLITVFVVYALREVGLSAGELGAVLCVGAVGALVGVFATGWIGRRLGLGRTVLVATLIGNCGYLLVAVPHAPGLLTISVLGAAFFVIGAGTTISNVHTVTIRQTATPNELQGRVVASGRFLIYGLLPVGAVIGAIASHVLGLRAAVLLCAVGVAASSAWILASPVGSLRSLHDVQVQGDSARPEHS